MKSRLVLRRLIASSTLMIWLAALAPGQRIGIVDTAESTGLMLTVFGASVGDQLKALAAGDFNGDGIGDMLVGTHLANNLDIQRIDAGVAYIVLGRRDILPIETRDPGEPAELQPDVIFFGAENDDRMGVSTTNGDINGDGIDDIVLGAPQADGPGNSRSNAGEVYIFYGSRELKPGSIRDVAGMFGPVPDVTILGEERNDTLGAAVALGQLNGSGSLDLIIGAPGTFGPQNTRASAGTVYIIFDVAERGSMIDLADPFTGADVVIHGAETLDGLGGAVASGDLNQDGFDDVALSAPLADGPGNSRRDAGEVYVLFGGPRFVSTRIRDGAGFFGPMPELTIYGQDPRDVFGGSLLIGDVSGDQIADLIIGAVLPPINTTTNSIGGDGPGNARADAGEVYVIRGSRALASEFVRDMAAQVARPADLTLFGGDAGDVFGSSLRVGDVSGDGVNDLIITAPRADGLDNGRTNVGEVYAFFGGPRLFDGLQRDAAGQVGRPADLILLGPSAGVNFGLTISLIDLDADGALDFIVGAPLLNGPENLRATAGAVLVVSGD